MTDFHDRFLIIDNIELHGLGSSISCLGRRVASYATRFASSTVQIFRAGAVKTKDYCCISLWQSCVSPLSPS